MFPKQVGTAVLAVIIFTYLLIKSLFWAIATILVEIKVNF